MSGENKSQPPRREGKLSSKDIGPIIKGWDYEPGTINVRKITGHDGKPKLQMRLDLGVLQMEMSGRPDGRTPHGCESLLEFFEQQLESHREKNGTDLGFHLSPEQCQSLREEAVMYYHRYLSLFVLEEFSGVVRDTARNLRVMDLCGQFAQEEHDRLILEQYRPYLLMMNARARASISFKNQEYKKALEMVTDALEEIREFFRKYGQEELYSKANEVRILKRFAREIRGKLPVDPVARLQSKLEKAVKAERYEEAAKLRDLILAQKQGTERA
jgi:hypothetical protein